MRQPHKFRRTPSAAVRVESYTKTCGLCGKGQYDPIHKAGADCGVCGGTGAVDSGGVTPWGAGIDVKCGHCNGTGKEPK